MAVNIGEVEGVVKLRDEFTAVLAQYSQRLAKVEKDTAALGRRTKTEFDKVKDTYNKTAASLDPVVRNTQRYEAAERSLTAALRSGIITQSQHNDQLTLARKKYLETSQSVDQLSKSLHKTGSQLSAVGTGLTQFVTIPLVALGGASIKFATDFESSFTGVRKTVDATEEEFAQMAAELRALATGSGDRIAIPIDVNELNKVAEAAGQLGIAKSNIVDFTATMADLAATTNLTADQAATSTAQFQNIFGAAGKDVDRFGSTLVALGNQGASTEAGILQMAVRIAGAGKQIGLTQGETLAFANTLSSLGIEAEAGGSAISKIMIEIALAVSKGGRELAQFASISGVSSAQFQKNFKDDAAGTVNSFVEGLSKIASSGGDVIGVLDKMGISEVRMRDALLRLAGSGDLLEQSLVLQKQAWQDNNALTEEAKKRYQTFESELRVFGNQLKDVGITLGTSLLPVLKDTLESVKPIVVVVGKAADIFSGLPNPIKATALVVGALAAATGPALIVIGQMSIGLSGIVAIAPKFVLGVRAMAGVLGPGGVLVAAVTAALLSINSLITKYKEAMDLTIQADIKFANIEGRALQFASLVKAGNGKVSETFLSQAIRDAEDLRTEIGKTQAEINKYYRDTAKGGVGLDPRLRSEQAAGIKPRDLQAAEARIVSLGNAYKRLIPSIAGVQVAAEKAGGKGGNGGAGGTGLAFLTEAQDQAAKSVKDAIADLAQHAADTQSLWAAAVQGIKAYEDEQLRQKIANEIIERENKLREVGLGLTAKQADQIEKNIRKQDEFNRKLELTLKAQAKIGAIELRRTDVDILFEGRPTTATGADPFSAEELVDELQRLEDVTLDNAEAFRRQREESDEFYKDFSQNVRDGQKSIRDQVNEYIGRVVEAHESGVEGALTAVEMEKELARARLEGTLAVADAWAGVLSTISGLFGNFGQQVISSIQQMISTAQQLQTLGGQIGGSAGSAISSAGPFLAVAGAIYGAQRESIARQRQRQYTSGATFSFGNQDVDTFGRQGRAIADQLASTMEDVLGILGRTLSSIPRVEIQAREDGRRFSVMVGGFFQGVFDSLQEAMDAAAIEIARYVGQGSGISETMRTVLANTGAETVEELTRHLNFAEWFDNIGLGTFGSRMSDLMLELTRAMEMGDELGLGTSRITDWFADSVQQLEAELLGIDLSAAEALQNLRGYREEIGRFTDQQRDTLRGQIAHIQEALAQALEPRPVRPPGGGAGGGGTGAGGGGTGTRPSGEGGVGGGITKDDVLGVTEEVRRLQEELARLEGELANTTESLSDVELDMGIFDILHRYLRENRKYDEDAIKVARLKAIIEFEAIKKQLILLGRWEEFAEMFADAFNAAMEEAGKKPSRGRGGAGGGQRDSVSSFIADREFQLGLASATAYNRAVAELNRTYDEQLKQAGKDQKLRTQLLALKERELALLRQEQAANVTDQFREFLGLVSPFDQVTNTATDLIKEIENSPFGNARKAAMIGRVLGQVDKQLDKLAREKTLSLFNELASDLERLGIGEAQSIEIRKAAAILEHHIKLQHYKTEVEILRASGRVAKETLALLDAAIITFEGADPNAIPKAEENTKRFKSAVSATIDAIGDLAAATEDATRTLLDIFREISDSNRDLLTDENLSALSPVARRDEAARVYEETLAKARTGDVEALRNFTGVRQTYLDIQRSLAHSGPAYAALFEKVIKEGAGLVLSPETGQAAINNLIAEQTATVAQGQALLHQDLLQLRSSVVDSLVNLSSRLGQPAIINGIPRFAQFSAQSQAAGLNVNPGAGSVGLGSNLSNDNATSSALIDSIQSTGDATVRSLGVVSHEVTMMRGTIETLNQRLSVLENGISRVASLGESTSRASSGRNR